MAQGLDLTHLDTWIRPHVPEFQGPLTAEKFSGGQSNPTFKLTAGDRQYVLRRKPLGTLLASAHAVDREFKALTALSATNVPVPVPVALCEDETIIGSIFYVMEYLEGRIFWDPALPEVNDVDRGEIYDQMNKVLADMHNVDIHAVGLSDYGKPGNYFERQIGRWTKQYRAAETSPIPAMEKLIEWLPNHMPEDDGRVALVHGDYRLDNMIFHPTEPKIIGVLDWELSTLGHPLADLAYQLMAWQFPRESGINGLAGLDRAGLNIPDDDTYIQRYCERTGTAGIDDWNFYMAFCFFRLASITQGIRKRALIGTASSPEAEAKAAMVEPLSAMGAAYTE